MALDPLELGLWVVVSCLVRVLGTKLGTLKEEQISFSTEPFFYPQINISLKATVSESRAIIRKSLELALNYLVHI